MANKKINVKINIPLDNVNVGHWRHLDKIEGYETVLDFELDDIIGGIEAGDIINNTYNYYGIKSVKSHALLASINTNENKDIVYTEGYYDFNTLPSKQRYGGGFYRLVNHADTLTGGTINIDSRLYIQSTFDNTKGWVRIVGNFITPEMFGCKKNVDLATNEVCNFMEFVSACSNFDLNNNNLQIGFEVKAYIHNTVNVSSTARAINESIDFMNSIVTIGSNNEFIDFFDFATNSVTIKNLSVIQNQTFTTANNDGIFKNGLRVLFENVRFVSSVNCPFYVGTSNTELVVMNSIFQNTAHNQCISSNVGIKAVNTQFTFTVLNNSGQNAIVKFGTPTSLKSVCDFDNCVFDFSTSSTQEHCILRCNSLAGIDNSIVTFNNCRFNNGSTTTQLFKLYQANLNGTELIKPLRTIFNNCYMQGNFVITDATANSTPKNDIEFNSCFGNGGSIIVRDYSSVTVKDMDFSTTGKTLNCTNIRKVNITNISISSNSAPQQALRVIGSYENLFVSNCFFDRCVIQGYFTSSATDTLLRNIYFDNVQLNECFVNSPLFSALNGNHLLHVNNSNFILSNNNNTSGAASLFVASRIFATNNSVKVKANYTPTGIVSSQEFYIFQCINNQLNANLQTGFILKVERNSFVIDPQTNPLLNPVMVFAASNVNTLNRTCVINNNSFERGSFLTTGNIGKLMSVNFEYIFVVGNLFRNISDAKTNTGVCELRSSGSLQSLQAFETALPLRGYDNLVY